jgi:hypothetical protein
VPFTPTQIRKLFKLLPESCLMGAEVSQTFSQLCYKASLHKTIYWETILHNRKFFSILFFYPVTLPSNSDDVYCEVGLNTIKRVKKNCWCYLIPHSRWFFFFLFHPILDYFCKFPSVYKNNRSQQSLLGWRFSSDAGNIITVLVSALKLLPF